MSNPQPLPCSACPAVTADYYRHKVRTGPRSWRVVVLCRDCHEDAVRRETRGAVYGGGLPGAAPQVVDRGEQRRRYDQATPAERRGYRRKREAA